MFEDENVNDELALTQTTLYTLAVFSAYKHTLNN